CSPRAAAGAVPRRVAEAAGCRPRSPHLLRHSPVGVAVRAGWRHPRPHIVGHVRRQERGRMLDPDTIAQLAGELAEADRTRSVIPRITARHPEATIEDSYAIQGVWRDQNIAAGRRLVGRKIGLTSKAMQQATGISEPEYGVMFDDTVYRSDAEIPVSNFSNVRIEVELAFVLKHPLEGPECTLEDALAAIDYAVPALEVLNSHIELEGRTIVDTISDNAAYGAMVLGDVHKRPDEIDLRWVPGVLSRNGEIEETGVAQ